MSQDNKDLELVAPSAELPAELASLQNYAAVFIKSGMFPDTKNLSQGIVRIMAGRELGLEPFASMRGIDIIQGQPRLAASAIATVIKRSSKYDYRVPKWTTTGCTIAVYEIDDKGKKEKIGEYSFEEEDARTAGLLGKENWRKYPKNMYFARAISGAARTFCPDVFVGSVYSEDELDQPTDAPALEAGTPDAPVAELPPETETPNYMRLSNDLFAKLRMSVEDRMSVFKNVRGEPKAPKAGDDEGWQAVHEALLKISEDPEAFNNVDADVSKDAEQLPLEGDEEDKSDEG